MAAVTPKIRVADPVYNAGVICERLEEAYAKGAKIIVFPELCITGYTCGDLFLQQLLLEGALAGLSEIQTATRGKDALVAVGLPIERDGCLYNVAALLWQGEVLGLVPKANIPSYAEFYEGRHFTEGNREPVSFEIGGKSVPFGTHCVREYAWSYGGMRDLRGSMGGQSAGNRTCPDGSHGHGKSFRIQ